MYLVRKLIDETKADYMQVDRFGNTALHTAAQAYSPSVLNYLVSTKGMDINSQDLKGNTPIHWACY